MAPFTVVSDACRNMLISASSWVLPKCSTDGLFYFRVVNYIFGNCCWGISEMLNQEKRDVISE